MVHAANDIARRSVSRWIGLLGVHRSMSDSFGVKIKSETLQVAQSHDGSFAADGLERRDVEIVAYAARGDHRDAA